ncbi:MAG TPA: cyclic lactone autoinducer peptide [Syntrophomonadaceae bacterium]|nr:cyclic lactone autoinducer peptide [Syntrophomonadaceae bacterium]
MRKMRFLGFVSAFLLAIAQSGVTPACWFNWYQPKLPE